MQIQTTMPAAGLSILHLLTEKGYAAYFVGGCVRDCILGRDPHDWDIATSATPEQVKGVLTNYRILDTGLKHGTVTVLTDSGSFEVTTFRSEGEYSDHRRPDNVDFVANVEDDLARRDFTMNAIALAVDGTLIDPYGGCEDIERRTLRCVGDPDERFCEDPLRILRGMRFVSQLGFSADLDTMSAMMRNRNLLSEISAERIQSEFSGILLGQQAYQVLMRYREIVAEFVPEIRACFDFVQNNPHHCYDVYQHILVSVDESPADLILRLTMFFHDIGKPACYSEDESGIGHFRGHAAASAEIAKDRLSALRYDNATIEAVTELVLIHDTDLVPSASFVRRMLNKIGETQFRRLLDVRKADVMAQAALNQVARTDKIENTRLVLERVLACKQAFRVGDLAVNGKDLLDMGFPEGPVIGRILGELLEEVISEMLPNERDALLKEAENLKN